MYLHEAIDKLLRETGNPMTTDEIATKLNENQWYIKKDSSPITQYQIYRRVTNYNHLFTYEKPYVSLNK